RAAARGAHRRADALGLRRNGARHLRRARARARDHPRTILGDGARSTRPLIPRPAPLPPVRAPRAAPVLAGGWPLTPRRPSRAPGAPVLADAWPLAPRRPSRAPSPGRARAGPRGRLAPRAAPVLAGGFTRPRPRRSSRAASR